jgi:hypothetical protein
MELHLDDASLKVLREVLNSAFRDLRSEIRDTDNASYKHALRDRERIITAMLDAVGGPIIES